MDLHIIEADGLFSIVDQNGRELSRTNARPLAERIRDLILQKAALFRAAYFGGATTLTQIHRALSDRGFSYAEMDGLRYDLTRIGWRVVDIWTADGAEIRVTNIYPPAPARPQGEAVIGRIW